MSLLLDALKKAAQEKQNTSSADAALETEAMTLELTAGKARSEYVTLYDEVEKPEELELPDEAVTLSDATEDVTHSDFDTKSYAEILDHHIAPTPSTVTDEALQLLINKTNHAHKKSRIITWGSVITASLILLTAGGLYFYFDMLAEIEAMQRKHQIALATLKSKTKIEENLTSLAGVTETENRVDRVDNTERSGLKTAGLQRKSVAESSATETPRQNFSVQRAQKRDPISEALQLGWAAYHNKDYELSSLEYRKVLDQEPKNHDALLGLAAVSLQLDDMDAAREIYIQLLELDPRDPRAHAGLANIAQRSGGELNETKLKQLIEYRPDDAHLQFALGNLYVQKESWPEAQQAFFAAWKADNQNPDYAYNLAVSLDHLGKHRPAKTYYEESLQLAAGKNVSFSPEAVRSRLSDLGATQ